MRIAFDVVKTSFFERYLYQKPYVFKSAIKENYIEWRDVNEKGDRFISRPRFVRCDAIRSSRLR